MRRSHSMEMAMSLPGPRYHPFERLNAKIKAIMAINQQATENNSTVEKSTDAKTARGKASISEKEARHGLNHLIKQANIARRGPQSPRRVLYTRLRVALLPLKAPWRDPQ